MSLADNSDLNIEIKSDGEEVMTFELGDKVQHETILSLNGVVKGVKVCEDCENGRKSITLDDPGSYFIGWWHADGFKKQV